MHWLASGFSLLLIAVVCAMGVFSTRAHAAALDGAEPLTGDVAAAYSTTNAASANPANAAFLDRTQIQYNPELFASESTKARYPGFAPATEATTGLGNLLSKPGFVYKITQRLGVGGYVLPPLPFGFGVHKERIPVLVLNQLSYVDITGNGKLNAAGQAIIGYKLTANTGLGLNLSYTSVAFDAKLSPSEGGDPIAVIDATLSDFIAILGVRSDVIPGRLAVGMAARILRMHSEDIKIDSPLVASDPEQTDGSQPTSSTLPLESILVGMQVRILPKLRLLTDLQYTRVDKSKERTSLVELKSKPQDLHDTLAVRSAVIYALRERSNLLFGFKYEPASLGAGRLGSESDGESGSIGFGTMELVQIWAGLAELQPYYQASAGWQYGFAPEVADAGSKRRYYQWTVASGVVYRYASLGIDEDGELPGAYLRTRWSIPLQVTWRL